MIQLNGYIYPTPTSHQGNGTTKWVYIPRTHPTPKQRYNHKIHRYIPFPSNPPTPPTTTTKATVQLNRYTPLLPPHPTPHSTPLRHPHTTRTGGFTIYHGGCSNQDQYNQSAVNPPTQTATNEISLAPSVTVQGVGMCMCVCVGGGAVEGMGRWRGGGSISFRHAVFVCTRVGLLSGGVTGCVSHIPSVDNAERLRWDCP